MIEIRIHGRGGQGAVTASKIIALAFFEQGWEVQSFPAFGVERRGAPVSAFARVDKKPIRLRSEIYEPDHVIVLDINLIDTIAVTEGLKKNGSILINASIEALKAKNIKANKIGCIDASSIAVNHHLGSPTAPIINTAIIGAFAGFTGLLNMESVLKAIRQETPVKQEENIRAAKEAYKLVEVL
jgi:2-oxoacid:acceptor oxidoreductase gamma subunit (pyruvate/2-ketoisovalerate family)